MTDEYGTWRRAHEAGSTRQAHAMRLAQDHSEHHDLRPTHVLALLDQPADPWDKLFDWHEVMRKYIEVWGLSARWLKCPPNRNPILLAQYER